ncbi:MAG: hypothetical protein GKS00_11345 [Alphaproteobacteria bacterium]|nr:hypothetical protein [Alphaproteobacteria bacterium]NKC02288.1 hypothetical protein [Pseudomonadales bacterium]
MPDEISKKRPRPYSYRPPEARRAEFEDLVSKSGLSFNAFITEAIFGRNRHRPAEIKLLACILGQCAAIADQLRSIRSSGLADNHTPLLESIDARLKEIRSALLLLMGRKP